ncbi:4861_t:CDS:2, partial [Funneliformis mosseae]
IQPDSAKIEKIVNPNALFNVKQLRTDVPYNWTKQHQEIFEMLKEQLTTAPILSYPDFNQSFILSTDASTTGLGAVLSQKNNEGREHPIWYASRTLSPAEKNYHITEQEALAVVWA